MPEASNAVPEGTYIELVRSLFTTLHPAAIMVVSFIGTGALLTLRTYDRSLLALLCGGTAAGIARLAVLIRYRHCTTIDKLDASDARRLERCFAVAYLSFALILGAFGARAFWVSAEGRTLVVALLFGYGAGVAAGLSLRPWISVPAVLIAVVPTILTAFATGKPMNWAIAALFAVFTAGGVESMIGRYRSETRKITMRRMFSTLARRDELTGLANRLSLRERFDICAGLSRDGTEGRIAVHCLDLDSFKPVNDKYGHPVGDALLKAVADRLTTSLRASDFVARIGGDEFVIVQCGLSHESEAEALARRVADMISQPFSIEGHTIRIGTSIGYVVSIGESADMDRLIACADEALCQVKREGRGIAAYGRSPKIAYLRVA